MLSQYPILFDGTAIPWPETWEEAADPVERVSQTEAGTDQIILVRPAKWTISASFQCSSLWARRFRSYALQDSVVLRVYDPVSGGYAERAVRIRGFASRLVRQSHKTAGTDGLYEISFDMEEF